MAESNEFNETILMNRLPGLAKVHLFDELGSTNDFGKQLSKSDSEFPALIYAHRQTKGRGRGAKSWISNSGSLTFSLILERAEIDLPRFSLTWGMAIAAALNEIARKENRFQIKWPNDVLAKGRKVAGVLIESVADSSNLYVVGIGVNVSGSIEGLDDGHRGGSQERPPNRESPGDQENAEYLIDRMNPISFEQASGYLTTKLEVLEGIWTSFNDFELMSDSDWQKRFSDLDALTSTEITIERGQQQVSGKYLGIAEDCSILIESGGRIVKFSSGSLIEIRGRD